MARKPMGGRRGDGRSVREWVTRGVLAAAAAGIGYLAVAPTLAYTLRTRNPERAHALAPGDGRITALLAQKLSGAEASTADRARGSALARRALDQDPTSVVAAATLGLNRGVGGDAVGARRILSYAQRLSRRDLQTQIWAVEDAVGRGDIAGALRHYDIALRTSRTAPDLLFPVLSVAMADPAIRVALVRTLAVRPAWTTGFLDHVSQAGPEPRATIALYRGVRRAGVPVSPGAEAAVLDTLGARGFDADAWSYYAAIRPGADRRRSRDPRFVATIDTPTPFDWTPINDAGVSSSIQRTGRTGLFDFAVRASMGGAVLRQRQLLPPGTYRLVGHSIDIDQPSSSLPYWVLTCADGREVGRVAVPPSSQAGGVFSGRLSVPAGCRSQTLTLIARPSDAIAGVTGRIDRVQLAPIS